MGDPIVNKEFEISVTQQGAAVPGKDTLEIGDFLLAQENSDVEAPSGKPLLIGPVLTANVADALSWGCEGPGSPNTALPPVFAMMVMNANATDITSTKISCFKKGCTAQCSCAGTDTAPNGAPVPFVGSCKFEITEAGQEDVEAG